MPICVNYNAKKCYYIDKLIQMQLINWNNEYFIYHNLSTRLAFFLQLFVAIPTNYITNYQKNNYVFFNIAVF